VDDGEPLPKEKRLAEIVRRNTARGRKTLVFVEQTATRDIRERLRCVIETEGGRPDLVELAEVDDTRASVALAPDGVAATIPVRVGTLSSEDTPPRKREAWIRLNAPSMDALMVNPKIVETGLDLVMLSDIIFYELNASLYVVWQAMRRVWRLGQKNEVHVWFLVYRHSCESGLLRYMGVKMKHAMLLYGKEAAGSLIETDDDDYQRQRIRAAMQGVAFEDFGELSRVDFGQAVERIGSLFTTGEEAVVMVDESPSGSPVAASPVVQTVALVEAVQLDLFGGHVALTTQVKSRRSRR